MLELKSLDQKIRNALRAKRNLLFADFSKNPSNTRLALEIKLLDDEIAHLDTTSGVKHHSLSTNSVVH